MVLPTANSLTFNINHEGWEGGKNSFHHQLLFFPANNQKDSWKGCSQPQNLLTKHSHDLFILLNMSEVIFLDDSSVIISYIVLHLLEDVGVVNMILNRISDGVVAGQAVVIEQSFLPSSNSFFLHLLFYKFTVLSVSLFDILFCYSIVFLMQRLPLSHGHHLGLFFIFLLLFFFVLWISLPVESRFNIFL